MCPRTLTLGLATTLLLIGCGPRLAPRIDVPDDSHRQAYTAFWWNCVIVKSIDLTAACPSTCTATPAAPACSAGATDAQNAIAELEKKYGPERTREILSLRIGEEGAHSRITSHFPFGPTRDGTRE